MSHAQDHFDRIRRYEQIPLPIRDLAQSNFIINNLIDRFVLGQIVTVEELQWQMVKSLAAAADDTRKRFEDYTALCARPIFVSTAALRGPDDPPSARR